MLTLDQLRLTEPVTEQELSIELRAANADGLVVIPRGGGTKMDWGNPPVRADLVLSTARLNRVVDHAWADLTVTVEAGCTIAELQRQLALHRQRLAIDVLWPERATIGGILSTNDSGVLRLAHGGLRDLVIGMTLVLPDGTIARSGGKVVKNVAGYDLPKLATGALGTLGVVTQAIFRLHPIPQRTRTLTLSAGSFDRAQALLLEIQGSSREHAGLQIRAGEGQESQIDILLEGTEAGIAAQEMGVRDLARGAMVSEGPAEVWRARQDAAANDVAAKFSVLPAHIAATIGAIERLRLPAWRVAVQGTGIGWLGCGSGTPLAWLRGELERDGGSMMILRQEGTDAWGSAGDAFPIMRALKSQFDPKGTLNPGRFVGGI